MQNMSLQTIGLLDASLPLALPGVSSALAALSRRKERRLRAVGLWVGAGWPDTGHTSKELGEGFLPPSFVRVLQYRFTPRAEVALDFWADTEYFLMEVPDLHRVISGSF